MICTFTARRLRANAYDAFRAAWDPRTSGDELAWLDAHLPRTRCRRPDVVISFGLFNGSLNELREAQARLGRQSQVGRVKEHVQDVLLDGSYEVVEELVP